jgi:hypothetical protein
MTLDNSTEFDAGHVLTSFAADLTDAAYSVVLRHGIGGSWIDLQLDVWRVLAASITEAPRPESRSPSPGEFYAWRELFLSELTDAAYRTALYHGLHGPFLDVELDLHIALREVIERSRSSTGLRFLFGASARTIADAVIERLEHQSSPSRTSSCGR